MSMIKIKIKNLNKMKDLKIGLFSSGQFCIFSFNNPGLWNWIVVDKKKYKKKQIKTQYELLNLIVSCSFLIRNKEVTINNNKCRLNKKLPIIKDRGKV